VDPQVLPADASAHRVDDRLRSDFPPFRATPIRLAVEGNAAEAERVARAAERVEGVADVRAPVRLDGDDYVVEVVSASAPLSAASEDVVNDLRALDDGALTNGSTASFMDLKASLAEHVPLMLAIVIAVTMTVLFLFTGSLVLPLKQILMNLLGLSAVFGILVLVFQDGRFESVLGYTEHGGLDATQPLFLFAVAFGLSTDYGVFLLSRIKEARDGGADNRDAVAIGLERVGRIATAAALLFAVAIGAFVTSEMVFIKELGLGTALAVLIDATIIRALLVPSLMEMLGKWNWWSPRPLRRIHARLGFSDA
jgi:RND superfamily putative drug exporter